MIYAVIGNLNFRDILSHLVSPIQVYSLTTFADFIKSLKQAKNDPKCKF